MGRSGHGAGYLGGNDDRVQTTRTVLDPKASVLVFLIERLVVSAGRQALVIPERKTA